VLRAVPQFDSVVAASAVTAREAHFVTATLGDANGAANLETPERLMPFIERRISGQAPAGE
jgi:hypothetical protein